MQSKDDLLHWLALWHAPDIGPIKFFHLLNKYPHLADLFSMSKTALRQCNIPENLIAYLCKPNWSLVEKDMEWMQQPHHHIVTCQDTLYPPLLREIKSPPPTLFIQGDPSMLHIPQIAMVGSRNPTPLGIENATLFSHALASAGVTITSGLALGIDAASHRGALTAKGLTIAVMGTGLDCIYPARHQSLAQEIIAAEGVLVSELPLGTLPQAANFPRRNRIISGLTLGVLVIEATLKSGSLITARYAIEQGREVFAIPGSIHNPLARGCHTLLQQGAKLVEKIEDIIEELTGLLALIKTPIVPLNLSKPTQHVDRALASFLEFIDDAPNSIEQLIHRSGLTANQVSSMLLELELAGHVYSVPGGYQRLRG